MTQGILAGVLMGVTITTKDPLGEGGRAAVWSRGRQSSGGEMATLHEIQLDHKEAGLLNLLREHMSELLNLLLNELEAGNVKD